jgi:DHA1 family bicyclomycin/chloramphenicol resistance-like MFS transporter
MGLLYLGTFGFGMSTGPLQTLALAPHGEEAGTAAALMGTLNFLITSLLSPIYTLLPTNSMAGIAGAYLVCYLLGLASTLLIVKPALRGASLR